MTHIEVMKLATLIEVTVLETHIEAMGPHKPEIHMKPRTWRKDIWLNGNLVGPLRSCLGTDITMVQRMMGRCQLWRYTGSMLC